MEDDFRTELLKLYQAQKKVVIQRYVDAQVGDKDSPATYVSPVELYPPGETDEQVMEVCNYYIAKGYLDGAEQKANQYRELVAKGLFDRITDLLAGVGKKLKEGIEKVLTTVFNREYWAELGKTTRDRLERMIQRGLKEGKTVEEMVELLEEDQSGAFNEERVDNITRTETTGALNGGGYLVGGWIAADGTHYTDEWVGILDNKIRPAHRRADGTVRNDQGLFDVGGELARYPGDPMLSPGQRCNCRCWTIVVESPYPVSTDFEVEDFFEGEMI